MRQAREEMLQSLNEHIELDEAKIAKKVPAKGGGHFIVLHRDTKGMGGKQDPFLMRTLKKGKVKEYGTHVSVDGALKFAKNRGIIEEVELDEGRMKELHGYIEQGMSAKEIAKKMKLDVKTIQALMPKKEEIGEASAAADARRAMRGDPDMRQRAFSKDDSATDDERKAASKNIMMQMRKAVSLRSFDVEFADGKKVKIPQKMAQAVLQKYNSFRKPADKEKYQAKVGKSYKDMLAALKESLGEEKRARQLINPNKEVMVVNKNKVIVIDKKDEDKYLKKGWKLAEEVELDEA